MSAALERGDRALRDYQALLERGTPEDIWIDEMIRGAAVRWDILKRRALDFRNFSPCPSRGAARGTCNAAVPPEWAKRTDGVQFPLMG